MKKGNTVLAVSALCVALVGRASAQPVAPSPAPGAAPPVATSQSGAIPAPSSPSSAPAPAPGGAASPAPAATTAPSLPPPAVTNAPEAVPPSGPQAAGGAPAPGAGAGPQPAQPNPDAPKTPAPRRRMPDSEYRTTWDLNIDGAYGRVFSDNPESSFFGRVRGGIMNVNESIFTMLGATYEVSSLSQTTLGLQGEWLHLQLGVWVQAGGLLDVSPTNFGGMGAVGWSLFGVEFQYRGYENIDPAPALYGKIRIPLGVIGHFLATQ